MSSDCIYAGESLSVKEICQMMGISERAFYNAGVIRERCSPEVQRAVADGSMSQAAALRTIAKRRTVSTTFPANVVQLIEADAERLGIPLSEWMREAILQFINAGAFDSDWSKGETA